MTATDELRRRLDERGMEYGGSDAVVYFEDRRGYKAAAWDAPRRYGEGVLCVCHTATPEQVISATLGSCNCSNSERTNGTCSIELIGMDYRCSVCDGVVGTIDSTSELYIDGNAIDTWSYCPNCGRRVEQ